MKLSGAQSSVVRVLSLTHPEVRDVLRIAQAVGAPQILEGQAAALYVLAKPWDASGKLILEIGTGSGYSAAIMAQAAPKAEIITLTPAPWEVDEARHRLRHWRNVWVIKEYSWNYFDIDSRFFDMVFVDGDHREIVRDLPWFNRLGVGGLMLFHDYTPSTAERCSCPPVYEAVDHMAQRFHGFDVRVIDDEQIGLAGFYRRDREVWQ